MTRAVSFSRLGQMGRWGNMLLQALFVHTYARRHGAEPQLPEWVGERFFDMPTNRPDRSLSTFMEKGGVYDHPLSPLGEEVVDHDYIGYCQFHTSYYSACEREYARALFQARSKEKYQRTPYGAFSQFEDRGGPIIGVHLRRGDYGQLQYYITPVEWYLARLRTLWHDEAERPLVFVASEDPDLVAPFAAEFDVVTTESMGIKLSRDILPHYAYLDRDIKEREPWQMDFFPDWFLLSRCDYLLIPNSTFSFTAAMLNPHLKACYRSSLPQAGFEMIDPWNAWPLTFDHVEDYPHIPGIGRESNPYWTRQPGMAALKKR